MTLDILNKEIIKAMKSRDTLTRNVLRSAVGNIKKAAIDRRVEITESLVDEVLLKELKVINEMIETCPSSRLDLFTEYTEKKSIICKYVPQLISDKEEVKKFIYNICDNQVFENKGLAMKTLMPQLKGKVDMKIANQIISEMF